MEPTKTTCPYCGVGCGVLATPNEDGTVSIAGDPDHPANFGRLCSKGSALGETTDLEGRLLHPMINGSKASWDQAISLVAEKFQAAINEHGPDSVAFYVSGQLLTEDYYVANKLMKGFFGSANIDTNSRLCMASSVAGHKRAFGTDTVPGTYEDLEEADLLVLTGSNLAWCHPVLYQRIVAAKTERPDMKVVVIDPRRTATCDLADLHLALKPGTDVALFNALLTAIAAKPNSFREHVIGLDEAFKAAAQDDPSITGLTPDQLTEFLDLFLTTEKTVTIYSQGVNQAADGTDRVNAIINCHLATGRIGKPGMGPFSVTGQPNAMGGREVGGLANMLACHLDLENAQHREAVQTFWNAPNMPEAGGLKAVDLFDAVASGKIKALWIMSTNPAVSMPDANRVRDAIKACDFTVVSDIMERTDTGDLAHVLLPASGWGEKNGTVTNSDRTISRQRAFLPAPSQTKPDWQIICDVARAMGWGEAFAYQTPADIFRESAALSGIAGKLGKDFDISAHAEITNARFESWIPKRWGKERFFADGHFFTPDRKARALPIRQRALPDQDKTYPLTLNTGRVRDHWHTMTRTGKSQRLSTHLAEPFIEIHPSDATRAGITPASLVSIETETGTATAIAVITDRVPEGSPFAPLHWTAQWSSEGRIDATVPAITDPVSGQPALKSAKARLKPFAPDWYGFAVSCSKIDANTAYWATAKRAKGYSAEIAGKGPHDFATSAAEFFGLPGTKQLSVTQGSSLNLLLTRNNRLEAALYIAPNPITISRGYIADQLGEPVTASLLAGRPPGDQPDPGATLCSCFNVGVNTILSAIETDNLTSVEAIGDRLQAGTNCGSCRPELKALLDASQLKVAAQ